MSKINLLCPTF